MVHLLDQVLPYLTYHSKLMLHVVQDFLIDARHSFDLLKSIQLVFNTSTQFLVQPYEEIRVFSKAGENRSQIKT